MKCVIQTIPKRLEKAKQQAEKLGLPCQIHIDNYTNPFNGLIDSLKNCDNGIEYVFHMQDDIILCDDLKYYIPEVERIMIENNMELMSLYAPRYKVLLEAYKKGRPWIKSMSAFALQAVVFSPKLVRLLLAEAPYYAHWKHADWFVTDVCMNNKVPTHVHVPSLTQHDIGMKSSIGNPSHERRTSHTFVPDFVTKWKQNKKNERA
jgi:hypothetical protein